MEIVCTIKAVLERVIGEQQDDNSYLLAISYFTSNYKLTLSNETKIVTLAVYESSCHKV